MVGWTCIPYSSSLVFIFCFLSVFILFPDILYAFSLVFIQCCLCIPFVSRYAWLYCMYSIFFQLSLHFLFSVCIYFVSRYSICFQLGLPSLLPMYSISIQVWSVVLHVFHILPAWSSFFVVCMYFFCFQVFYMLSAWSSFIVAYAFHLYPGMVGCACIPYSSSLVFIFCFLYVFILFPG